MRKRILVLILAMVSVLTFSSTVLAAYTASNDLDMYNIASIEYGNPSGSIIINSSTVSWFPGAAPNTFDFYVDGVFITTYIDLLSDAEDWRLVNELTLALGLPLLRSGGSLASPTSSAAKTTRLIFNEVVMPSVMTKTDKEKAAAQKEMGRARTFGGQLRYENVDSYGADGDVVGFNLGLAQDYDNMTLGLILPYDKIEYDNLFEADRIGVIFYGQYNLEQSSELSTSFTGNLNYMYADLDYDSGGNDNIGTIGGGLSAAATLDKGQYASSAAVSYQYNKDDIDIADDEQHLLKLGANTGYRIGENHVATVFGVWNKDITSYDYDLEDDNYFDLGAEATANFSEAWGLTVGYKKVVGLEDFDSDEVYFGSILNF